MNTFFKTSGIAFCAYLVAGAVRAETVKISVIDSAGKLIESIEGENFTQLSSARIYQEGDKIRISGAKYLTVQVDDNVPQSEVFLPEREMDLVIPFGEGEAADRQCWGMNAFAGSSHTITARVTSPVRLKVYRNLALNPSANWKIVSSFPHAIASHAFMDRSVWSAKATIDGMTAFSQKFDGKKINNHVYPNQAWGPDQVKNPWIRIDFGREVEIDQVSLFLRDYFAHDKHWSAGRLHFPNGEKLEFEIDPRNAGAQNIAFPPKKVCYIQIENLSNPGKIGWASFSEIQVYGRESSNGAVVSKIKNQPN